MGTSNIKKSKGERLNWSVLDNSSSSFSLIGTLVGKKLSSEDLNARRLPGNKRKPLIP